MKEYLFNNRVWINGKGKTIDRVCTCFAAVFVILSLAQIVFKELGQVNIPMFIFAIGVLFAGNANKRRSGKYLSVPCRICICQGSIDWYYQKIDLNDGKGSRSIHYRISDKNINEILLSNEMKSIRIDCKADIDIVFSEKNTHACVKGKKCVLVIYNDDSGEICKSLNQLLNRQVEILD